jgi:pimeloyl-ACP methyl ester carboxylesterase
MTPDLPEALTAGREEAYLGWFYRTFCHRPEAIGEADLQEYLRTYRQPGAMRAGFSLYRALPKDIADNQESLKRGRLRMPTLAMGGAESWGRRDEVGKSLRLVAESVEETVVADCGHFLPEEQPQVLAERLRAFFDGLG